MRRNLEGWSFCELSPYTWQKGTVPEGDAIQLDPILGVLNGALRRRKAVRFMFCLVSFYTLFCAFKGSCCKGQYIRPIIGRVRYLMNC
jgi:hypothetical protein